MSKKKNTMDYIIRNLKYKNFQLEQNEEILAEVLFESWTNNRAKTNLLDAIYSFKQTNFWKSRYLISKNDYPIGFIKSNWKGHLSFELMIDAYETAELVPANLEETTFEAHLEQQDTIQYTMKGKGLFNPRFEIFLDDDSQPTLTLFTKNNWFKVHYEVVIHQPNQLLFSEWALMCMFGYGALLIQQRRAAAGATAG